MVDSSYSRLSFYTRSASTENQQRNRLGSVAHNRKSDELVSNVAAIASQSNITPRQSLQITKVTRIAAGKAKQVLTHPTYKEVAYYIPFKPSKEKELRNEVQTAATILSESRNKGLGDPKNIALTYEELPKGKGINNFYTVKTDRAESDGEKFIRNNNLEMDERVSFASDIVNGFAELHNFNFVYGDVKAENILVFEKDGKKVGKLSDLGKTQKLPQDISHLNYSGNPRFMPPEGVLSKEGDVYGLGLMLIRIFEEPFLDDFGDLIKQGRGNREDQKFRGIERCIVKSKQFLGTASGGIESFSARIKAVVSEPESKVKQDQKRALEAYIKHLEKALLGKYKEKGVKELVKIISSMTQLIPSERPTSQDVKEALSQVKLEEKTTKTY